MRKLEKCSLPIPMSGLCVRALENDSTGVGNAAYNLPLMTVRSATCQGGWRTGTMNPIIDFLKQTEGTVFVNEDGCKDDFTLKPPLTEQELLAFETSLPCPLPDEIRELLRFARGFDGVLDGIDFADSVGLGLEDIFPHARSLAADGWQLLGCGFNPRVKIFRTYFLRLPRCTCNRLSNRQSVAFHTGSGSLWEQTVEERD